MPVAGVVLGPAWHANLRREELAFRMNKKPLVVQETGPAHHFRCWHQECAGRQDTYCAAVLQVSRAHEMDGS